MKCVYSLFVSWALCLLALTPLLAAGTDMPHFIRLTSSR